MFCNEIISRNLRRFFDIVVFLYLVSAIVIFSTAALAKITAPYTQQELRLHDPFISFLTVKQLVILATGVEMPLAALIFMNLKRSPRTGLVLVLWLAAIFLAYRLGFAFAPENALYGTVCKCFGGPGSIIGKYSDVLAWSLLAYLLGVGVPLLFCQLLAPASIKKGIEVRPW